MKELIEKRKPHAKLFHMGGNERKLVVSRELLHRTDEDGKLVDLDLTPAETPTEYKIQGAGYSAVLNKENLSVVFTSDAGDVHAIDLLDAGVNVSKIVMEGRAIKVIEAFPGVDLLLSITPEKIEWYKRIKTAGAKSNFKWQTSKPSAPFRFRGSSVGTDADGNKTELNVTKRAAGNKLIIEEDITGRVSKIADKSTRIKKFSTDMKYPLFIDVPDVSVSIGAGGDDAWELEAATTETLYTTGTGLQFGGLGTAVKNVGLRFGGIAIPQGATITDAKVIVQQAQREESVPNVGDWYGVDVDNLAASPWSVIGAKAKTTAKTAFQIITVYSYAQVTHPVTGPVQEIINRSGWSSSNGLGLIAVNATFPYLKAGNNIAALEHATEAAPKIEINFTVGPPPLSQGIIIS